MISNNINSFSTKFIESFKKVEIAPIEKHVMVNGHTIKFVFFNLSMAVTMTRPFQHIKIDKFENEPDLTIYAADSKSTNITPDFDILSDNTDYLLPNQNLYFNNNGMHMLHNTLTTITSLVNLDKNEAYYYIDSLDSLPDYEKAAPFRMIFHWFCQKYSMNLIHSAVIGKNGEGFLVAGRGGAGKSTMSLLSLIEGSTLLGDDYVIVNNEDSPIAFSLYNSIKVNPDIVEKYPYLDHYLANRTSDSYDKGFLFADEINNINMALSLKINGLVMITGEKDSIPHFSKHPKLKALSVIGSSTAFQMPGINNNFLKNIVKLVDGLDVYKFVIGPSIKENVRRLNDFIEIEPLVSVILPVFNGSERISDTMNSVLNQTYKNIELIIVDDGSVDNTAEVTNSFNDSRIKYIYQENTGPGPARNNGIGRASGRYIAFVDHDDVWYPEKIEKQLSYSRQHPQFPVIYCKHNLVFKGSSDNYPWVQKINGKIRYVNEIPSSLFIDSLVFDRIGMFNPRFRTAEDSDFHLRIKDAGIGIKVMDDKLLDKHIHGENISQNIAENRKNIAILLSDSIRRKRFYQNFKISVIIPSYNPDMHLVSCLKSILSQSLQPYEIIIADDGSKNDIGQLIKEIEDPRIKIFRQKNKGISGARNFGINNSSGNILAFIDSDDLWAEDKLELQIQRLISDSTVHAVFGWIRQFYSPEVNDDYRNKYYFEDKPTKGIISGTLVIKKDDFYKVGPFNENLRVGELFDWIHRFKKLKLNYVIIPDVLMYRRLHYNNNGIKNKQDRVDFTKVFTQIIKDKKNEKS